LVLLLDKYDPLKGERLQILDKDGQIISPELEPELDSQELKSLYRFMILSRVADEKAINLQRQGRLGTYAPLRGQEAAEIGSAYALPASDWMFPSFRELAAMLVKGMPLESIYLYWMGDELGNAAPEGVNIFPISIPVGTQTLHAVGVAWAAKIRGDDVATLVYFGDGGTSEGDFHEAMNFAGVFQTPTVFFCQNNQYAISVPRLRQTASKTLAQKAVAYGFRGVQVDGNDILAVYTATKLAITEAHAGNGPTMIEAYTYRLGHHTTADDATRYRTPEEIASWEERDPIKRFQIYLQKKGLWDSDYERSLQEEVRQLVDEAAEKAENQPAPSPEDIFRYTYAEMPWILKEQLDNFIKTTD
jgi:pyruvate dehydrogenase E1 component alpha subunit